MTTVPDHEHAFSPDDLTDLSMCTGHRDCTLTYGEYRKPPTVPGPTGPLPCGWNRVTWKGHGKPRHVVTTCVGSAAELYAVLELEALEREWITDVAIELWVPTRPDAHQ